jgi:hypothetical protein
MANHATDSARGVFHDFVIAISSRGSSPLNGSVRRKCLKLLFPEMSGTVCFLPAEKKSEISTAPRMFCPSTAVDSDQDGKQFVWVADSEKRTQKIAVKAGDARDGRTEIVEGLSGKERVIVNPEEMQDGVPLQIIE